jgi:PKHD-type hydroxylase
VDRIVNGTVRKLSFTLQLSDPADYDGGELQLMNSKKPTIASREQGYVMVFPSYTLHEVTPVTRGTRYSLVSWVTGKPFK